MPMLVIRVMMQFPFPIKSPSYIYIPRIIIATLLIGTDRRGNCVALVAEGLVDDVAVLDGHLASLRVAPGQRVLAPVLVQGHARLSLQRLRVVLRKRNNN